MGLDIHHLRGAFDEAAAARGCRPGCLGPKAKLIGFISKMMITLRMPVVGLHPHTRIVVASDLIVVLIADAARHHRPVGLQSLRRGRRVQAGAGTNAWQATHLRS
jgi:hypothetical protein